MNQILPMKDLNPATQKPIIYLPQDQNSLVVGASGTGKTTLALQRANYIHDRIKQSGKNPKVAYVCHHRALSKSVQYLQRSNNKNKIQINTYLQWLAQTYDKLFSEEYPRLNQYRPDCAAIINRAAGIQPLFHHIVLDQAQYLSADMISLLGQFSEGITVFVNENDHSGQIESPIDTVRALSDKMPTYRLNHNYRSHPSIATFVKSISSLKDERPDQDKFYLNRSIKFYKIPDYQDIISLIVRVALQKRGLNVGVILPQEERPYERCLLDEYYESLSGREPDVAIQTFGTNPNNYTLSQFEESCVKLLWYKHTCGFEFDTVIIPEIDHSKFFKKVDNFVLSSFRMACSSASRQLILIYQKEQSKSALLKYLKKRLPVSPSPITH